MGEGRKANRGCGIREKQPISGQNRQHVCPLPCPFPVRSWRGERKKEKGAGRAEKGRRSLTATTPILMVETKEMVPPSPLSKKREICKE